MRILADAAIPQAEKAFARHGTVTLVPGRDITRAHTTHADALIVRSVTRVDAALLDATPVRFVGTATIGIDHLDTAYLDAHGIPWASAAGCNARSVVEYVMAVVVHWCLGRRDSLEGLTLGIVGHGNIGSRLAPVARAVGMKVLVCDPPLHAAGKLTDHVPLDRLLPVCDIVTCHVPYTLDGPHPTHHLIDVAQIGRMRSGTLLINAARGNVVNNATALAATRARGVDLVLDVFAGEPRPNRELVHGCRIATPHIAGYSLEGKLNGTLMMAAALGGGHTAWRPDYPPVPDPIINLYGRVGLAAVWEAIRHSYDPLLDDGNLRAGLELDDEAWGRHFDGLRRQYRIRREFANYRVVGAEGHAAAVLGALGFQIG
jgi:erythronate-4-phosphate dehydrogenase